MNKGNKAAPKKTVSVAASAPLLPHGEQYTPCEAKRRHMAGMTPYHPSAYSSILAGSDSDDAHAILEKLDVKRAALLEPQLPVILIKVDEEFWNAPEYNFNIPPPLDRPDWDAIPPVECRTSFSMKFQSGTKTITRIQLPLIPAFALTVHKSQGLNKAYELFVASSRLFARALSYVVLSRCTTLEGLYIVGKKINTKHFEQTFGREDGEIKAETARLRRFQGNTLRKGYEAACMYFYLSCDSMRFGPNEPIVLNHDEPEFDGS
jgi:hypothetical protein